MRIFGSGVNIPGKIRSIGKRGASRYLLSTVFILCFALGSSAWAQGNLASGSLSTPKLYDSSSYGITDPAARAPVANPPGGLIATAAWFDYGMRLDWNVSDNGDGTYTYHYYFGPGWYPPDNGTGGGGTGTGNPYVTNKFINALDIQLGSGITNVSQLLNVSWNIYQFDGKRIGTGDADSWANYVDPDTGNVLNTVTTSGAGAILKVAELTGKTGNATVGYSTNSLFHGLQWFMPIDPVTNAAAWNTNVNFDLTFTSTYAPGWGNFFSNSTRTGSNNNYSEVVAFDGTFNTDGKSISTLSNGVAVAGGLDNTPPTAMISAPSASITRGGPVSYTVTYSDDNFFSITLPSDNITLNRSGTASGTVSSVEGTGNSRTVTINNITGNGTLGISLPAGTATDKGGNAALAAGPSSTFTVDNSPPSVAISAPSLSVTQSGPVTYTVTYNDDNFDLSTLSASDLTLVKTGSADGTVSSVSGLGSERTVTISNITGTGTLGITLAAGTARDLAGNLAQAAGPSTSVTITRTIVITTNSLPNGAVNTSYNQAFAVNGGITPCTWSATGLPTGLTINPGTGVISGTPANVVPSNAAFATFSVTITVQDSASTPATASTTLSLRINQTAPAASSGLVATAPAANRVVLTWTDNANNEVGVQVQRATNAAFTTGLVSVWASGINRTTYTDNSVAAGNTYYYRVRTGNYVAWSTTFSNTATVTTSVPVPAITTTSLANGAVNASYTQTVAAIDGTTPFTWSATGLPTGLTINPGTGVISGTPANVVPSNAAFATFSVTITVQDSASTPATASTTLSLRINQAAPAAPSGLVATAPAASRVVLTWTDNAINEVGVQVQRATNAAFTTGLVSVWASGINRTTYTDNSVAAGNTYYYRVRSGNYVAWSTTFSNTATVTTP